MSSITAAEDIREGDYVDLTPPLDDSSGSVHPWVHQPFGAVDEQLAEAVVATARMAAQDEYAIADASTVNDDGTVNVYTDVINLVVPAGYQMTVTRNL